MYTPFWFLINNMDHMRISGNEPSSAHQWSEAKQSGFNSWKRLSKSSKPAEAKKDRIKTLKVTISINFDTENFDALWSTSVDS